MLKVFAEANSAGSKLAKASGGQIRPRSNARTRAKNRENARAAFAKGAGRGRGRIVG